jgi:uncharacterized protein (TIGR03435 family)
MYDVVATMPPNTPKEQIALMLQTLLAERFKLVFHRDTKLLPTWALVTTPDGPRIKPAAEGSDALRGFTGDAMAGVVGDGSLSSLAYYLSKFVRDPVVDLTGLKGAFTIDLKWPAPQAPDMSPSVSPTGQPAADASPPVGDSSAPTTAPQLFKALEKIGLKLERRRLATEFLRIEYAEKAPVDN